MDLLLEQLIQNIAQSGLMSADEVRAFVDGLPADRRPGDGSALASQLTTAGRLTPYQAESLCSGAVTGLKFDEYVVQEKIGEGGMGVVLKGEHLKMHRPVAIKRLHPQAVDSKDAIDRFYREVEVAAKLSHDNIVTAYDAREHDRVHYLIMEYVEGQDLATIVRQRGALPVDEAVDYVIQAAQGLAYAHSKGIVHRDIKPGNLLVAQVRNEEIAETSAFRFPHSAIVKILDMGLARIKERDEGSDSTGPERLTTDGQVMGTGDYMAPEQADKASQADHRADIYSLGCTLYRLLTGRSPYSSKSLMGLLIEHREAEIPPLRDNRPDVPQALDDVYQRMVAKRPEDRYQSMNEVIAALQTAIGRAPTTAAAPPPERDSKLTSFLDQIRPEATVVSTAGHRTTQGAASRAAIGTQQAEDRSVEETIDQMPQEDTDPSAIERRATHAAAAPKQPPRRKSARQRKQTWMLLWIGAGLGLSLIGAAVVGLIIYSQTNVGTVVVDAGDHHVEVVFTRGGVNVDTIDTERIRRAELEVGEYQVSFKDEQHRLVLDTDTISVTRGGETRVKVMENRKSGTPPPGQPINHGFGANTKADSDLAAALWVIERGGFVQISEGFDRGGPRIQKKKDLPSGPFRLYSVFLTETSLTDDDLSKLQPMPELRDLHLNGTGITSAGLANLPDLPNLHLLHLANTGIDDKGIPHILRFPKLGSLLLRRTSITDAGMRRLRAALPDVEITPPDDTDDASDQASGENLALEFDGQTAYVEISSMTFDVGQPMTIEALVQPRSAGRMHVVRGERFLEIDSIGHWRCGTRLPNFAPLAMSDLPVIGGQVVHLASVYDGRQILLYVNGQPQLITSAVGPSKVGEVTLFVGGPNFDGVIDELRVSGCVRYQAPFIPAVRFEPDDDTLALLHFDGTGNTARDASGKGNDGQIHGAIHVPAPAYTPPRSPPAPREIDAMTSPDLKAAAWASDVGGTLSITLRGDLEYVSLIGGQVKDEELALLSELKQFYYLDLQRSTVTDEGLEHLAGLRGLRFLLLDRTKVTDNGLRHLAQLSELEGLHLNSCDVTDAGIEHLAKMHHLTGLFLSYTKVTDKSVPHIKEKSGLTTLDISGTKITEAGVQALREALPDCRIIWP